ncbi:hypothetical protein L6279_03415 [Candidatus Parcubacteria bacterium]|nr:hypothetical protein [Patescibacteria group bacterium]MCG2693129.1 hypothetical protein [Candidatus Parcubacteria bacterium]
MKYFIFRKQSDKSHNSQKGVSLYFAVVITSLFLAIAFGLTAILVSQVKIFKEMGDSVNALFAADSGMEKILYIDGICRRPNCTSTPFVTICEDQALQMTGTTSKPCLGLYNYSTSSVLTNNSFATTTATTTVIGGATTTIFQSKGIYKATQRAIEASR